MDSDIANVLSYKNEVFRSYIFWSCVLLIKIIATAFLTGLMRIKNQVRVEINKS